jgi:DNA-binding FadR family transcriptional regulator
LAIEPTAAQFAALRASAEEVAVIQHWYKQMEINVENPEICVPADMTFHSVIWAACHNDLLTQMNATIGAALRATQDLVKHVPGSAAVSLPFHAAVADAISQHNPSAARQAMERLIKNAALNLYEVLHINSP